MDKSGFTSMFSHLYAMWPWTISNILMNLSEVHFLILKYKVNFYSSITYTHIWVYKYVEIFLIQYFMLIYWCFKRLFIYYLGSRAVYYTKIDGLVPFSIEIQAEESMIEERGNIREGSVCFGAYPLPNTDGRIHPGHSIIHQLPCCIFILLSRLSEWSMHG